MLVSYLVESENLRRKQQEQQDSVLHKENKEVEKSANLNQKEENFSTDKKIRQTRKIQKKQNQSSNRRKNSDLNEPRKIIRKKSKSDISQSTNSDPSLKRSNSTNGFPIAINQQKLTKNALFHSPTSILTKLDLKALFQPSVFESLPRHFQLKVIKLLPECDRQVDSTGRVR